MAAILKNDFAQMRAEAYAIFGEDRIGEA